jgi:hypothetical protein
MKEFGRRALLVLAATMLFVVASAGSLWATPVPEIDPSSGISVLTFLAGVAVVVRGWRSR